MKVITFSIAAKHLLLISPYTLRVQCLELWIACILLQYHWDKGFHNSRFSWQNNHYDSVRLGVVYLNLVFSRANRVRFCEICLQFVAYITTIYLFYFIFKFFFLNNPRCPILHHRSCILGPDFPVNLEVLLIKIILFFKHWSNHLFQSNRRFQTVEFVDRPVPEKFERGFLCAASGAASRVRNSQVQSYPYKHIRDTYVTLGWISTT